MGIALEIQGAAEAEGSEVLDGRAREIAHAAG